MESGRTHQIRVHMQHLGYPLVGDPVYGGRPRIPAGASEELIQALRGFGRQALHATDEVRTDFDELGRLVEDRQTARRAIIGRNTELCVEFT